MLFSFNLRIPTRATRDVSSRDIRRINLNAFKADVGALQLDSSDLLHRYNSGLRDVLDKHDIVASLTVPPHPGLQCRSRRRSRNEDVLNSAGESQDLCTDKSSSTTARRWRNSSCKQRRTTCATRLRAVLLAKISSTSQISCQAKRRTAPSQAPSPLLISQIRLEISSRLRSRGWVMSLMLRLDSLTSRSSVVPLLKPSPLWQSSKWKTSSLKPQRSHACLTPSQHT